MLIIDPDKGLKIVLYAVAIIRVLRAAGPVFAAGNGMSSSLDRTDKSILKL
jgi:hypothetical protein